MRSTYEDLPRDETPAPDVSAEAPMAAPLDVTPTGSEAA